MSGQQERNANNGPVATISFIASFLEKRSLKTRAQLLFLGESFSKMKISEKFEMENFFTISKKSAD